MDIYWNFSYSIIAFKATALINGADIRAKNKIAIRKYICASFVLLKCCWETALEVNINIGIYNGRINSDSNIPEFFIPTINEAPIVPIKLKLGVASKRVVNNKIILLLSSIRILASIGDNNTIGSPVRIQFTLVLANTINAKECLDIIICSNIPFS